MVSLVSLVVSVRFGMEGSHVAAKIQHETAKAKVNRNSKEGNL